MKYGQIGGSEHSVLGHALLDYRDWLAAQHREHSASRFREWADRGIRPAPPPQGRRGAPRRRPRGGEAGPGHRPLTPTTRRRLGLPGGGTATIRPRVGCPGGHSRPLIQARARGDADEPPNGDPAGARRGVGPRAGRRDGMGRGVREAPVAVVEPGRLLRGAWQAPWPMRRIIARAGIRTIVTLTAINRDDPKYVRPERGWCATPGSTGSSCRCAARGRPWSRWPRRPTCWPTRRRQPVFFHCVAGHHRTSLVHAAYLIRHQGYSADRAWQRSRRCPGPGPRPTSSTATAA